MFGLLSAYVQGLKSAFEKRLASLEFDYRQQGTELNLIRSTLLAQYPTKEETAEHRERVEEELRYIRTRLDEALRRR